MLNINDLSEESKTVLAEINAKFLMPDLPYLKQMSTFESKVEHNFENGKWSWKIKE